MFLLLWSHDIHIFQSAPLFGQYQTDVPGTCGWTWKRFVRRVLISSPERSQNMKATRGSKSEVQRRGCGSLAISKERAVLQNRCHFWAFTRETLITREAKGINRACRLQTFSFFGVYQPQPQQCAWHIRRPFFKSNAQNCQNKESKEN